MIIKNEYGLKPEYVSTTLSRLSTGNLGPTFNHVFPTGDFYKVSLACDTQIQEIVEGDKLEGGKLRKFWIGDKVRTRVNPELWGDIVFEVSGVLEADESGNFWYCNETPYFVLRLEDDSKFQCDFRYVDILD